MEGGRRQNLKCPLLTRASGELVEPSLQRHAEAGRVRVSAAAVGLRQLRDVELADRIERNVDARSRHAIDDAPRQLEGGALRELVPDPAAVTASDEARRRAFREAALVLRGRIELFASLPIESLSGLALQDRLDDIGRSRPSTSDLLLE